MGHASLETTRLYTRPSAADLQRASGLLPADDRGDAEGGAEIPVPENPGHGRRGPQAAHQEEEPGGALRVVPRVRGAAGVRLRPGEPGGHGDDPDGEVAAADGPHPADG